MSRPHFVPLFMLALLLWRGTLCGAQEARSAEEACGIRANPVDAAEMVLISGGEFIMGSDEAELKATWKELHWDTEELEFTKSEQPAHRVCVDSFWMYRHLVTVAQYRRFCRATGCKMPPEPSYGWTDRHPVVNVSWNDANAYCQWAGCRLPSEAEWEYAARGGHSGLAGKPRRVFVWGNQLPTKRIGNLADEDFKRSGYYDSPGFHHFARYHDGYATASPVDAFPPNDFGVCDMAGNVLEWCEDWFSTDYYTTSPFHNPKGPESGVKRILRGGAFDTIPTITRIARRLSNDPDVRNEEKGFRCVKSQQ